MLTGEGGKYDGVFTGLEALIRALRSLPCGVTVQTLFLSVADLKPGAMDTVLAARQVTAKEAAKAVSFKDGLAVSTAGINTRAL